MKKRQKRQKRVRHPGRWLHKPTRMAIYLRDKNTCVYCACVIDSDRLSIDHLICYSHGGSNRPNNLATCCKSCNSTRRDKTLRQWFAHLKDEKGYTGVQIEDIKKRIRYIRRNSSPMKMARLRSLAKELHGL